MKSIHAILLTFVIVFFLFGVSESVVFPRNGSFPAAKTFQGLEGGLKERALSCPSYAPKYCESYNFCCPSNDVSVVQTTYLAALWDPTAVQADVVINYHEVIDFNFLCSY
ncbi:hypothetical protein F8M41_024462 [Gigaspora margarita]|uniref:Hydrophobin n=1 Tax=Gigaspora margarita TaxID=4874 RepID=A0A8H3XL40_GIGMA|nr:hypothetical protein F8M41_024462 [Gigaspora margarita]